MKRLNDKKEIQLLFSKYKKEIPMEFHTIKNGIIFIWFSWFASYRLIFFMQRCCDGMHYGFAWRDAIKKSKIEILTTLKSMGWE